MRRHVDFKGKPLHLADLGGQHDEPAGAAAQRSSKLAQEMSTVEQCNVYEFTPCDP